MYIYIYLSLSISLSLYIYIYTYVYIHTYTLAQVYTGCCFCEDDVSIIRGVYVCNVM